MERIIDGLVSIKVADGDNGSIMVGEILIITTNHVFFSLFNRRVMTCVLSLSFYGYFMVNIWHVLIAQPFFGGNSLCGVKTDVK